MSNMGVPKTINEHDPNDQLFPCQFCEYSGGILAEIMNEDEQGDVEIFLNQTDSTGVNGYWIGLTDLSHEGHWMWISSGKAAEYLNWGASNIKSTMGS